MAEAETEIDKHQECVENYLKNARDYDDAVALVASWNSIFSKHSVYSSKLVFFDWFPRLNIKGTNVTPDFASLFKDGYGFVGEIKSGFPMLDAHFDKELEQLRKYDDIENLKDANGNSYRLSKKDIVLFIKSFNNTNQIVKRILQKLADASHPFKLKKSNLILMSYGYSSENRGDVTYFAMERNPTAGNGELQEPELNRYLTEEAKSIKVPPARFFPFKSKFLLMNDEPPVLYTLVFLWIYVFHRLLPADQQDKMKDDPVFRSDIETTPSGLAQLINRQIFEKDIFSADTVRNALEALRKIKLATFDNDARSYTVHYKELTRRKKTGEVDSDASRKLEFLFAKMICDYETDHKKSDGGQLTFEDLLGGKKE